MMRDGIENRVKHILLDKGMSIRQLAEETGITYSMVYAFANMTQRSINTKVLSAICEVLQVQPGEVLVYVADKK